jgi:hypothetical protein
MEGFFLSGEIFVSHSGVAEDSSLFFLLHSFCSSGFFFDILIHKDEGAMILQILGKQSLTDTLSHLRRLESFFVISLCMYIWLVVSLIVVFCIYARCLFLLSAGKIGLMSRIFGSVDTEEVRELKVNLLEQRIQEGKVSVCSAQKELKYV